MLSTEIFVDLVSPHVKLGPVTTNNQAVFINIQKRITNDRIIHISLLRLVVMLLKIHNMYFSLSHFNSIRSIAKSYLY